MMTDALLIIVSILIALVRAIGVKHEAFQAIAHLWVGGLLGAYLLGRKEIGAATRGRAIFCLWLAVLLSIVEVLCFLVIR